MVGSSRFRAPSPARTSRLADQRVSVLEWAGGEADRPDRVGAPHAVFKIIGWQKADARFTARGFLVKQDDSGSDLTTFVRLIDKIEAETGLDFFADLDDEAEEELESMRFSTLWGND